MEAITFEICAAEGDPLDRTLGVLAHSGKVLTACRSYRIAPEYPLGTVLLWIDRLALAWARPSLDDVEEFGALLDKAEEALTSPF